MSWTLWECVNSDKVKATFLSSRGGFGGSNGTDWLLFVIIHPTCLPRMAWNTKQKPLTGVGLQNVKSPRVPWSQHIISLTWNQRRKQMKITTNNTQMKQVKEKFRRKDVRWGPTDGSGFKNEAWRQNLPPRLASRTPGLSVERCRVK